MVTNAISYALLVRPHLRSDDDMACKSSFARYLTSIRDQWEQIRKALPGDDLDSDRKRVQPPNAESPTMRALYKKAVAEVARIDKPLSEHVMDGLQLLQQLHQELLDEACLLWKSAAYYTDRDNPLSSAWNAVEAAWNAMDGILPAVNALAADSETSVPPQLTDKARAVLELLRSQPSGKGLDGSAIRRKLKTREQDRLTITQAVLTSHIMPILKQHYGVKNKRGLGYYVQK
jgi:hypothetical protein